MIKLTSIGAVGAAFVLAGALAAPSGALASSAPSASVRPSASAAGSAVVLKGHITTYGGKPITGVVVEVIAQVNGKLFNKGTQTSSTGRYAITVRPGTTYTINFIGQSSDDHVIDPEFVSKTGHIHVGSTDLRLNKSLHHDD